MRLSSPSLSAAAVALAALASFAACGDDSASTGGAGGGVPPRDRPECQGYEDEAPGAPVTFRLRNDSGVDAYVNQLCGKPFLFLWNSPDPLVTYSPNLSCADTCIKLRDGETCPPEDCEVSSLRVPAGASVDIVWVATGFRAENMPETCYASPNLGTCDRAVAAPGGSYEMDFDVFSGCGPDCACDANNVCSGEAQGAEALTENIPFTYPAPGVVEVVLEPCAFGCAGG